MNKRRLTLPIRRLLFNLLGCSANPPNTGRTVYTPNFSLVITEPAKENHDYTYTLETTLKDNCNRATLDKLSTGVLVVSDISAQSYEDYVALLILRILKFTLLCGFPPSSKQLSSSLGIGVSNAVAFWNPVAGRCVKQVVVETPNATIKANSFLAIPKELHTKIFAQAAKENTTPEELVFRVLGKYVK